MCCGYLTLKEKCFQSLLKLCIANVLLQRWWQIVPQTWSSNAEAFVTKAGICSSCNTTYSHLCVVQSGVWVGGVLWVSWPARHDAVARFHVRLCSLPNWQWLYSKRPLRSHTPGNIYELLSSLSHCQLGLLRDCRMTSVDSHSTPLHLQGGPLSHSAKAT